jgi:hypothetical protein
MRTRLNVTLDVPCLSCLYLDSEKCFKILLYEYIAQFLTVSEVNMGQIKMRKKCSILYSGGYEDVTIDELF